MTTEVGFPDPIEPERAAALFSVSRESIHELLGLAPTPHRSEPWFHQPAACFISLFVHGELRGCFGDTIPEQGLLEALRNLSHLAARDPRFPPIAAEELDDLQIEISMLSPWEPLDVEREEDALRQFRPGVDGLVITYGDREATLLPQWWHWRSYTDRGAYLRFLKRKARLTEDFWSPDIRLWRYEVQSSREPARR
jgi:AmmeMemoRadiSam system protein A